MNMRSNHPKRRVWHRTSIQLVEKDGYVVLGPDFVVTVKQLTLLALVVEAVFFPLLVLLAGLWWFFSSYTLATLIILLAAYGLLQTAFAVGLVVYLHRKMTRQTRFTHHPEGDITVKDDRFRDIFLEHRPVIQFVCQAVTERPGREFFDLWLEHDATAYYLISGRNEEAMQKLRGDLTKACGGPK